MSAEGVTPKGTDPSNIWLSDGFHCSDLIVDNGLADRSVLDVMNAGLSKIHGWLEEFEPSKAVQKREYGYPFAARKA